MPTEQENIQYLYLVLTNNGPPNIDMSAISTALNLNAGATSKRWSRLKQAIETGKNPGPGAYQFLWLVVKHSSRQKALNWKDIAEKCGTTPGAASKRYSRMKQAFNKSNAASNTLSKTKDNADSPSPTVGNAAISAPKRKRGPAATPKKKVLKGEKNFKPEHDEDDEDEYSIPKAKRKKGGTKKPRAAPKRKADGNQSNIKKDPDLSASSVDLNSSGDTDSTRHQPVKPDPVAYPLTSADANEDSDNFYDANEFVGEEKGAMNQDRVAE